MLIDPTNPLQARVAQLETEIRRIKRIAMGAALVVGVLLGAGLPGRGGPVSTRRITLLDLEGKPRVTLGTNPSDEIELLIHDATSVRYTGKVDVTKDGQLELRSK